MRSDSMTDDSSVLRGQPERATRMKAMSSETSSASVSTASTICKVERPALISPCAMIVSSISAQPASNSEAETVPFPSTSSCANMDRLYRSGMGISSASNRPSSSVVLRDPDRSTSIVSKISTASTSSASTPPSASASRAPPPRARARSSRCRASSSARAASAASGFTSLLSTSCRVKFERASRIRASRSREASRDMIRATSAARTRRAMETRRAVAKKTTENTVMTAAP
mmetsp:Transcript_17264/g.56423  ORF Transcript_17264/g.56423 Transcript_17264/m.56423 type:complete len:230 (+) Transcript_17264:610-1299(+)